MGTHSNKYAILLILMYHRALSGKYGNSIDILEEHLRYISQRYTTYFPGEPLSYDSLNLSLTFDDATCDFFLLIFPLLKKYKLKATLAVPTAFIQKSASYSPEDRLKLLDNFSFKTNPSPEAFCSWDELSEMQATGLVQLASHGVHHLNLLKLSQNEREKEFATSKEELLRHTGIKPTIFIYPYGATTHEINKAAKQYYTYTMRIGSSFNFNWNQDVLCRASGDALKYYKDPFSLWNFCKYGFKSLSTLLNFFRKSSM